MMPKIYGRYAWYVAMLLSSATIHSYRIIVSNGTSQDIAAAVYRFHEAHPFLIRTSVAKKIAAGQTMWFGGVLPSNDATQFLLYGASKRDALKEALPVNIALEEPYKLFDVGTGDQFFIITEHNVQQPTPPATEPSAPTVDAAQPEDIIQDVPAALTPDVIEDAPVVDPVSSTDADAANAEPVNAEPADAEPANAELVHVLEEVPAQLDVTEPVDHVLASVELDLAPELHEVAAAIQDAPELVVEPACFDTTAVVLDALDILVDMSDAAEDFTLFIDADASLSALTIDDMVQAHDEELLDLLPAIVEADLPETLSNEQEVLNKEEAPLDALQSASEETALQGVADEAQLSVAPESAVTAVDDTFIADNLEHHIAAREAVVEPAPMPRHKQRPQKYHHAKHHYRRR